jgi:Ca2+-binding EF-hand superfamily protein
MNRVTVILASLLLISTPLSGCLTEDTLEDLIDDVLGCMDEQAKNYDENATTELVGNCIYAASMNVFMEAMTQEISIESMLDENTTTAGYSMYMNGPAGDDFGDTGDEMMTIEEVVMVNLSANAAHVQLTLELEPMISITNTMTQVGEVVNVHHEMSGLMASQMAGESVDETYQTRDASPDVMEWVIPMMSGSFGSLMSMGDEMSDEEPSMLEDLENDGFDMANATMTVTFDSSSNSQTMDLSTTNETGTTINLSVMIDANSELMSYSTETSNASETSIMSYTLMWGDAVVITVDETLPKTAIPVHWDGLPESNDGHGNTGGNGDGSGSGCGDGNGDGNPETPCGEEGDDGPSAEELLYMMDQNGDDQISWSEIDDFIASDGGWESDGMRLMFQSQFNTSDENEDEYLSYDELVIFSSLIFGDDDDDSPSPEEILQWFDTDGDYHLSWDEFWFTYSEGDESDEEISDLQDIFDASDDDGDGLLVIEELQYFIDMITEYEDNNSDMWMCDDGEEIPADWVDDGEEDCEDGSDENVSDDQAGNGNGNGNGNGCGDGSGDGNSSTPCDDDEDDSDNEPEMWMCDDGEEIPADWVNDGMEDCEDGSDEDDSGMVCYDMDSHTINEAYENQEDCEYAGLMWTAADSGPGDGGDEHDGGYCHNTTTHENYYNSDEANCEAAGHIWVVEDDDHDDHDETSEPRDLFLTIADNQTFEAPLSDFSINFLSCNSDERSECMVEGEASLSSLTGQIGNSTYVYTDVDMDGMISAGDTLELTGMHPDYQFDLYDSWSDSYVSESGVNAPNMPGFGGLLATISMLGAAFLLPRRDD